MRSLRHVRRNVAKAPIHVSSKADDAMLKRLLRELSESKESSAGWRTTAGPQIMRPMAYLASVAIVTAAVAWLLYTGRAPQNHEPAQVTSASTSGITLLTEISLERAFRRGGIQAVESQFKRALPAPAGKSVTPSFEELLAELAGTGEDTGGTSL
jgi:hypothetical protein